MRSATPKVLHEVGGRSLVGHVLAAVDDIRHRHGHFPIDVVALSLDGKTLYLSDQTLNALVVVDTEKRVEIARAMRMLE